MKHCQPACDAFASVHPDVVSACESADPPIDWKCVVTNQCMATAAQLLIVAGCSPDGPENS